MAETNREGPADGNRSWSESEVPQVDFPDEMNAAEHFVDRNVHEGRGGKTAIVDLADGREYTYDDVLGMVNRFGNALRETLDTRLEERVLLLLLDSPAFAASFFGTIKVGSVPIPTNTLLKSSDYEYLLNDSRARVLVVSGPLFELVEPVLTDLRYLQHLVLVGEADTSSVPAGIAVHDFHQLLAGASAQLEAEMMNADDACFWLYSSGTTGFPKGTVHLQHDMLVTTELYAKGVLGMSESDRTFSVAKLFFAYGLGNGLYFPFAVGATTVLYPGKPDAETFFNIIEQQKPTLFFCVPTAYQSMLAIENVQERYDTSSLRACVSAGEALPAAVWERWMDRFGVEILDGIGSTEILHIFISNPPGACKPGSTGKVVPGYLAKVVDEEGQPVTVGEVGDLLVSGESTCASYWNKHQKTKDTLEGHWIRTGDKYSQDEDGYFYYQGRSDDMLKAGGIWVSPVEVECTLIEHEAVLEAAVVGAADSAGLVKPKAYVVLQEGQEPSPELEEELILYVRSRIAKYKYPRWIHFIDELPKTATGKVQRYKLR
ncbi:MAG: benzoate-CoA ligase family protein [Thermoleophilia bacterium]